MTEPKDIYYVAVKVFLVNSNNQLLITKDSFGDWDLPGGRLRDSDFKTPLEEVVARKITEELGSEITYTIQEPVVFMRHERQEVLVDGSREKRRIFAIGYKAVYNNGTVILGKNHTEYQWVDLTSFKAEQYFTGGWLEGVQEFQRLYC